jgi:hypothetical protein
MSAFAGVCVWLGTPQRTKLISSPDGSDFKGGKFASHVRRSCCYGARWQNTGSDGKYRSVAFRRGALECLRTERRKRARQTGPTFWREARACIADGTTRSIPGALRYESVSVRCRTEEKNPGASAAEVDPVHGWQRLTQKSRAEALELLDGIGGVKAALRSVIRSGEG